MRFQAPAGQTGINIGGEQFNADDKGVITVPDGGDYSNFLGAAGFIAKAETQEEAPLISAAGNLDIQQ